MCYSIIEKLNLGYEVLFFILGGVMCVWGRGWWSCLCYCRQWKYHLCVAACEGRGICGCVSSGEGDSV